MVLFNYSTKELTAKVVYYGAGLCGKTTNLHWIHDKVPIKNKGKMLSLATETDRTLFFDFLPIEIGTIRGMKTRIQLYTVPGQVFYNATRRMVLKGADCVVFVCDSQEPMLDANLESYENLRQNLEANEIDPDEIPMVLQYNKRDLPNALPIEILNERVNSRDYPFFEAVAIKGLGVEETLKGVTKLVFKSLSAKYGTDAPPASGPIATRAGAPGASPPAPPAAAAGPPRPNRRTATLPPVAPRASVSSPEDLLDNLELSPVSEEGDEEAEIPIVEEEDLAAPMPDPGGRSPKETMISNRSEADDLRRRISMPSELDVNLEQLDQDEDEIEEISLDTDPLPGVEFQPPARAPAPPRAAAHPPRAPEPLPPRAASAPARMPEPPPRAPANPSPPEPTPVSLEVEATAGETTVTLPVELLLAPGASEVRLNLRLRLKLKRSG